MKYYYYGNNKNNIFEEREIKASGINPDRAYNSQFSNNTLVIEDDTVYEIDEECLRCRK